MASPFHYFIEFVQADYAADALEKKASQAATQAQQYTYQLEVVQRMRAQQAEKLKEARKELHVQESAVKAVADELKNKEHKLALCQNPREYMALEKEIQELRVIHATKEDSLVRYFEECENLEAEEARALPLYQEQVKVVQAQAQEAQQKYQALNEQFMKARKHADGMFTQVRVEWQEKYQRLKQHYAFPVVPVENGACSGCFSALPTADSTLLDRNVFVVCKNCCRLLYSP